VVVYYVSCIAPYESTDDAFVDAYVTVVSSRVPGQVTQLLVADNQWVKEGDVLVELDPRDYETSLANAKADLATALGHLDEARAQVDVNDAKVAQDQSTVTAAEAENYRAADDLTRYAQETLSKAAVETAAAAVQQSQARVRQAELNLSYTKIIAPVDARVTARSVDVGKYVQPGEAMLALVPANVWVVANFKETQLTYMRPGQPAEMSVDAYPGQTFKGRVDSLQAGTGARFSLLPPENAVGNYVKVVQRVPVKLVFDELLPTNLDIAPGMSIVPTVRVK
jgi:membrane fusion protein (multidrug efflux system)